MGLFSKRQKEIFEESLEGGPTVIADKIQANVEEAGKGRGLGAQTAKRKTPSFSLSKAGENLYGASQGALDKQAELKAQREAEQQQSINSFLKEIMDTTERETQKYLPKGDTLGEATYLTKEEKKQRSITTVGSFLKGSYKPLEGSGIVIDTTVADKIKSGNERQVLEVKDGKLVQAVTKPGQFSDMYGQGATSRAENQGIGYAGVVVHHTEHTGAEKHIRGGMNITSYEKDGETKYQQVGYHFYIDRKGVVHQGAPLEKRVNHVGGLARWAAGEYKKRYKKKAKGNTNTKEYKAIETEALELMKKGDILTNENTIAITLLGSVNDATPEQLKSFTSLSKDIHEQTKIGYDKFDTHGMLPYQDRMATEGVLALNHMLKNLTGKERAGYKARTFNFQGPRGKGLATPLYSAAKGWAKAVSNSKTTAIQKYLNIKADGIYGNNTIKAIIDFQNKNNLKPDGKAGDATLEKMGIQ
tara:strand:+ start:266 stop:1681 length:1416 start_codon:yes stop_codon:yes gene_type:complete